MAKKKKKKYRQKYTTGNRVDMRTGGRVSLRHGGLHKEDNQKEVFEKRQEDLQNRFSVDRLEDNINTSPMNGQKEGPINTPPNTSPNTPPVNQPPSFSEERKERVADTGRTAQEMAKGNVNLDTQAVIPRPEAIDRTDTIIEQGVGQMTDPLQTAGAQQVNVGTEQVSTGDVTRATTPQERGPAQITQDELTLVPEQAQVDTAQGQVSRETTDVDVDRVGDLDSTQVQIEPGAVANRVVGVLSPEAKATAATNAGTSLARITRAKKQLSRAGLSEEDIATIGNDPEALEDRLADFSEEERGVIAGLPEEALVSTQLNGLLEGMENGEIPVWARPAVASVEAMLARRGLSASSVGRDNLFNAIVQSAMPIAQSNAQAIQQSVTQQRTIEAQTAEANAQRMQQTALANSSNVFRLNMAQFSADQQTELSNSKFLQTVSLTEASAEQQSIIQSAVLLSQANIAEANLNQQAQIQNAKNFLQMDLANLSAEQQSNMLRAQQTQQRLLSNQSAQNAAAQFNAASENQTNQFILNLQANMEQFNASQSNSMEQFNVAQQNAAEARRVGNELQANSLEAQLALDAEKFNARQEFARDQFNSQQEMVIAQSNVEWRRKANTADTAAINAVNQQNAQNAFSLTAAANNFLWQELRDEADFDFKRWDNDQQRKASLLIAALGNEAGVGKQDVWNKSLESIGNLLEGWLD